jgi:mevalonate kinase
VALAGPLTLVVVPSGVQRRTAEQVARVRSRHDRFPALARPLLEVLGRAVDEGITALRARDHAALGEIMQLCHGVLTAFGVSSPVLDAMCSTALRAGALGAKLTGAGGGGCILALPGADPQPLVDAFVAQGHAPLLVELTP